MSIIELNLKPTRTQLRQFSAVFLAFFGLVGAWRFYHFGEVWPAGVWFDPGLLWLIGALGGVPGLIMPSFAWPVYVGVTYLTFPIGFVISHVLFGAIYYLVFTPIGLIMKLSGRDALQRRFEPAENSYWNVKLPETKKERYFHQY